MALEPIIYIKVKKHDAEKVKNILLKYQLFLHSYPAIKEEAYILFPVKEPMKGYAHEKRTVEQQVLQEPITSAYDQIGDIVILKADAPKKIAEGLIKHKSVKAVFRRKGVHSGEFRTQNIEWVVGEKRTETIHKENGVIIHVDVKKCYFSPRLSTERLRIAKQVKAGEKVLVFFSGVAPYPLVIARHAKPQYIIAVEKNPIAHHYAIINCKKVSNIITLLGDAQQFQWQEQFDRIIMPLPKTGESFLEKAKHLVKNNGIIHFYDFSEEKDFPEKSIQKIRAKIPSFQVLNAVKCGQYSPRILRICIDIKVHAREK